MLAPGDVPDFLGPPRYISEEKQRGDEVGLAHGLAWTQYGGEVLHIEAQLMPGKGALTLTGQLGDVMKESGQAALSYARSILEALDLDGQFLADKEIHVHVPAGGVPKDGPSAGITMATVLVSLIAGVPIRRDVAMTGELTLRGRVLPIGGLKEKLLAAVRNGITKVLIPAGNTAELSEVPEHLLSKVEVVPVKTMAEVIEAALTQPLHLSRPWQEKRGTSPWGGCWNPFPASAPDGGRLRRPPSHRLWDSSISVFPCRFQVTREKPRGFRR